MPPVDHQRCAGSATRCDQVGHVADRPVASRQTLAGLGRVLRRADDVDHLVDVGHGDGQAHQHMGAVARLGEFEARAPDHHLLAEGDERVQHLAQAHLLGPAVV